MTRKMPPVLACLVSLAQRYKLNNALGRAVYVYNRRINVAAICLGGVARITGTRATLPFPAIAVQAMRAARPSTAARWAKHWRNGGSLKALSRTVAQERIQRSTYGTRLRTQQRRIAEETRRWKLQNMHAPALFAVPPTPNAKDES